MPKHILGIVCDPPVEGRSLWQDQISSLLATTHSDAFAAAGWTFVEVFTGSVLPSLGDTNEAFDAVIISGSIFNITDIDTTEWMQSTLQWVREFVAKYPTTPIVGICFGHQLLCTLFGGHVATNPLGWEVGTHVLTVAELPRVEDESGENDDSGFSFYGDAGKIIRVQETHSQIVATLPPHGASVVIGFTSKDAHHVVLYAPQVLGMQYHPEYSTRHMQQLRDADKDNGDDVANEWEEIVESSPESVAIVGNFLTYHWR